MRPPILHSSHVVFTCPWQAPQEREAVGKGMLEAMTKEERKAAWQQRKDMGEVTLQQGKDLDERS